MTALALVLATALLTACAGLVTLAVLNRKDSKEALAARDLLDSERELSRQFEMERDVEVAAHAVTASQLRETRERLAIAEAQRNQAYRDARDHYVEQIKNAPIADAAKLLEQLLAAPLPSVTGIELSEGGAQASRVNDTDLEAP